MRVVIVEDLEADAELLLKELRKYGYAPHHVRVETGEELHRALDSQEWDIVLSDFVLPCFSGLDTIRIVREERPDLPVIIVSGQIGEDTAVETMRAGAHDYLMKDSLKRLGQAIQRELGETQIRKLHRRAEQELIAKEEALRLTRKMNEMKDDFIRMVSHELRNPLTVIIGAIATAASLGLGEEEKRDLLNGASTSAQRLSEMVDNLLELSRYESHRLNIHSERARIEPLVQLTVRKVQNRSAIHRLVVDIPPDLPESTIDKIRIERVLNNLVENAIKYSPNGGEVKVFGRYKDDELVIGVSDQGIGIPREDQSKLFHSFERLDAQEKHDIGGIGLGLRVCRILIENHGGRIWVESQPGKGSTFYFTLPVTGDSH